MILFRNHYMIILLFILLFGCAHTESGNVNLNRDIFIKVLSGSVHASISGHIGENVYFDIPFRNEFEGQKIIPDNTRQTPMVLQGTNTVNQSMILHENQEFHYTLTTAEIVILNIRSIDDNDAKILVFEYGREKEYKIPGQNKTGQIFLFRN